MFLVFSTEFWGWFVSLCLGTKISSIFRFSGSLSLTSYSSLTQTKECVIRSAIVSCFFELGSFSWRITSSRGVVPLTSQGVVFLLLGRFCDEDFLFDRFIGSSMNTVLILFKNIETKKYIDAITQKITKSLLLISSISSLFRLKNWGNQYKSVTKNANNSITEPVFAIVEAVLLNIRWLPNLIWIFFNLSILLGFSSLIVLLSVLFIIVDCFSFLIILLKRIGRVVDRMVRIRKNISI